MRFSTPAEPFKFWGDIMVIIQRKEQIYEELVELVEEMEKSPTMESVLSAFPAMKRAFRVIGIVEDDLPNLSSSPPSSQLMIIRRQPASLDPSTLHLLLAMQKIRQKQNYLLLLERFLHLAHRVSSAATTTT